MRSFKTADWLQRYFSSRICAERVSTSPSCELSQIDRLFTGVYWAYENNTRASARIFSDVCCLHASVEVGSGNAMDSERVFGASTILSSPRSIIAKQIRRGPVPESVSPIDRSHLNHRPGP